MEKDLSRRGFFKGVLATGVITAAGAGLAACGAPAGDGAPATTGDGSTVASEGTKWSWDTAPKPIAADQIATTYDCDICVVGAGAAGVPAAYAAVVDGGAKTIVLQKSADVMTNGWCATAINGRRLLDEGMSYNIPEIYAKCADLANGRGEGWLVNLFLKRSGEVLDYIVDETPDNPMVTYYVNPQAVGHTYSWYRDNDFSTRYKYFTEMLVSLKDKAVKAGAEFLWETPAVQLIQDELGAVTGVIGQTADGSYVQVNAAKGVIMATGDLSDDPEMVECYTPLIREIENRHKEKCNTGDGHKMGLWAGASMDSAPHCIMMHWDPTNLPEGYAPFSGNPWLRVNLDGERYGNENLGYQSVVTACSLQPERLCFQIVDSNWLEHCLDYAHDNSHSRFSPNPEGNWEDAVERGAIVKANTIQEIADAYGINKDKLVATVARYNELVDKGVDEDYGVRGDYFAWNGIKEPPFYAIKRLPAVLSTQGGLNVNQDLMVVDAKGEAIQGLYAAGACQGSYYGYDYPLFLNGHSNGRAITFGVLAVKSALGTLDEKIISANAPA